mmetsp:Transcript_229/g.730  ORF Transcript_229/g.730 Transcript_229/m.730 type:complete len:212 (+) Transcript_229:1178-1813(+)
MSNANVAPSNTISNQHVCFSFVAVCVLFLSMSATSASPPPPSELCVRVRSTAALLTRITQLNCAWSGHSSCGKNAMCMASGAAAPTTGRSVRGGGSRRSVVFSSGCQHCRLPSSAKSPSSPEPAGTTCCSLSEKCTLAHPSNTTCGSEFSPGWCATPRRTGVSTRKRVPRSGRSARCRGSRRGMSSTTTVTEPSTVQTAYPRGGTLRSQGG